MRRQQLGTFAVELDVLVVANVNLCEVVLVEVAALEDIAVRQNLLFLQLALGAEDEPCAIEFLVLLLHLCDSMSASFSARLASSS